MKKTPIQRSQDLLIKDALRHNSERIKQLRTGKTFTELGDIMLREVGAEACQKGYGTTEPIWIGCYAMDYGDINRDGTLN